MANEKRLIDANALIDEWNKLIKRMFRDTNGKTPVDFGLVIREVSKAPTVDAVEVVRCKDCKHGMKSWLHTSRHPKPYLCRKTWEGEYHEPDYYCAYGERKDND